MPYKKDEIACECSVVGVFGCPDAVYSCRDGLHATSHRGQDDVGIATSAATEKSRIVCRKHLGLARDVPKSSLRALAKKDFAIGHNRYATAGPVDIHLAQPFVTTRPMLGYAANGDIPPRFYQRLKRMLKKNGVELATRNDGELSSALLAYKLRQGSSLEQAIREFMQEVTGSYAAVMLYKQYGIAFRDPLGIRPLVLGRGRKDNSWWMVASETTALQIAGADYQREVLPGELLIFAKGCEPVSIRLVEMPCHQQCIFELIYFSRPEQQRMFAQISRMEWIIIYNYPRISRANCDSLFPQNAVRLAFG